MVIHFCVYRFSPTSEGNQYALASFLGNSYVIHLYTVYFVKPQKNRHGHAGVPDTVEEWNKLEFQVACKSLLMALKTSSCQLLWGKAASLLGTKSFFSFSSKVRFEKLRWLALLHKSFCAFGTVRLRIYIRLAESIYSFKLVWETYFCRLTFIASLKP